MTTVTLTAGETAALEHRLTCDGLIEVTVEEGFTRGEVEDAIDTVSIMVAQGRLNSETLDPVAASVLRDCVEGSTWIGCVHDNEGAARGARRVLNSLARKLELIGISDVSAPAG